VPQEIEKGELMLPAFYRYNPILRYFMMLLSALTASYSIYFMAKYVRVDTPLLVKIIPTVIIFIALDNLLKHLTTLNTVYFHDKFLALGFIARRNLLIPYDNVESIVLQRFITYYIYLAYLDDKGKKQVLKVNASFPKILDVMLLIYDNCPNLKIEEQLKKMLLYVRKRHLNQTEEPPKAET